VAALTVASGVLVAAALGGIVGHEIWRAESSSSGGIGLLPTPQATNPNTNTGGPQDAAAIAGHVDPGLVDVNTEIDAQGVEGAGTGMVLTSSGEVLTNNHVVEGANRISVTDVGNGHTYAAEVVGYDRSHDIAVLQLVGASGLQTVTLGNSSRLNVGQAVVAIGNANGSGGTPSYAGGTITALDQTITASDQADGSSEQLQGLVETDADVVSGDSGGPLVDGAGRVIGMDTAASGAYRFDINGTQGFAIPISEAVGVARQIEAGSSSATIHIGPTALLGVEVRGSGAAFGGLGGSAASGAAVVGVIDSGPAARMGIVAGDVITSVGGHVVTSAQSLTNVMLGEHPGATVAVQYLDTAGQEQTVQVKLASGPPQ
jgi:S1-C subfamily serine protease